MYRREFPEHPDLFAPPPNAQLLQRNGRSGRYKPALIDVWRRNRPPTVFGTLMVLFACGLLFWEEGRTVQTSRSLNEGNSKVVVPETNDVVFEENNGKLVLIADQLKISDPLLDTTYGISIKAVKLKRTVQMFQWYETEDPRPSTPNRDGGGDHDGHVTPSYSYATDWFDRLIDSSGFNSVMGHHNPDEWPINSSVIINSRAKLGGFLLGSALKEKFTDFTAFTSDERPATRDIKMHAGLYFHAVDVWKPEVGDIRIQFSYSGLDGDQLTVVGKQSGRELRPYSTESGDDLLILQPGIRRPSEVFQHEHSQNRLQTWIMRTLSWFVAFLGFVLLTPMLDHFVDDRPRIRNALTYGSSSIAFAFSLSTTVLIIGVSWIIYRPWIGGFLLAFAIFPFCLTGLRAWSMTRRQNGGSLRPHQY